ncbi:hypothetical protein [Runella aurantiaca]|uniref:CD-NTase-associated protein 12/Pycsar effector protein TIR domain-containing protein n=1 Tax=Runella aurantiaca TaxID=2282308 RepID=A0A369HXM0_9BACT|nr:hypothetical protein [Runella aurantiaca]RDB02271.1 hypothetical protein DVG78_29675 [Runella aurantiaca]
MEILEKNWKVFYSWQSDIKKNRKDIESCIRKSIETIRNTGLELSLDRDTQNTTGSPDIVETIFNKIALSDIFICDVTIVNSGSTSPRFTPNPNVLIELGFAINSLGWDRIICINNLACGRNEELPFDIRKHRILSYNSENLNYKENLKSTLKKAIETIIEDFDKIVDKQRRKHYIYKDQKLFEQIVSICSETELYDTINSTINRLIIYQSYYDKWDELSEFTRTVSNHFIDDDLQKYFEQFIENLNQFRWTCSLKFFDWYHIHRVHDDNDNERFTVSKFPIGNETYAEADTRIDNLQDLLLQKELLIKESYKVFRKEISRRLLI